MAPPPLPHRHYAPPSHVTEDTPPDLLEGTMDLEVSLPNGKNIVMNVHRSTPMMDLLIQVTTAHRINPGGHVIQLISDNIFLTYKPSTPIGTLDTNIIKIVAKNKINEIANKRKSNLQQQAIERNIRLKVNLPHNQLAVYRVPPKALISDIFTMVCEDKNLDAESHEIRHPVNVDERLRPSCSLSDYQLQEVCVVSSDFRPPPLSVTDLITMSSIAHPEDKKRRGFLGLFARKAKSSTGDSSISSGSAEERSVSPARSDESTEGRPTPMAVTPTPLSTTTTCSNTTTTTVASTSHHNSTISINSSSSQLSRPVSMISLNKAKKRPAPIPPRKEKRLDEAQSKEHVNGKAKPSSVSLSRHGSDSSGCHEADNPSSPGSSEVSSLDATRTEAVTTSSLTISGGSSSLSISACPKGKRKAPSPPKPPLKNGGPMAILESPEEVESNLESKHEVSSPSEAEEQLDSSKLLSEEGGLSSDNVHRDSCKLSSEEEDPSPDKVHSSSDICEDIQQDVEEKDDFSEALVTPTHSDNSSDSSLQQNDNNESNVDVSKPNEDENTTNNHPRIEPNNDVSVEPSVEPELESLKAPVEEANNTSPAPQSSSDRTNQSHSLILQETSHALNPSHYTKPPPESNEKSPLPSAPSSDQPHGQPEAVEFTYPTDPNLANESMKAPSKTSDLQTMTDTPGANGWHSLETRGSTKLYSRKVIPTQGYQQLQGSSKDLLYARQIADDGISFPKVRDSLDFNAEEVIVQCSTTPDRLGSQGGVTHKFNLHPSELKKPAKSSEGSNTLPKRAKRILSFIPKLRTLTIPRSKYKDESSMAKVDMKQKDFIHEPFLNSSNVNADSFYGEQTKLNLNKSVFDSSEGHDNEGHLYRIPILNSGSHLQANVVEVESIFSSTYLKEKPIPTPRKKKSNLNSKNNFSRNNSSEDKDKAHVNSDHKLRINVSASLPNENLFSEDLSPCGTSVDGDLLECKEPYPRRTSVPLPEGMNNSLVSSRRTSDPSESPNFLMDQPHLKGGETPFSMTTHAVSINPAVLRFPNSEGNRETNKNTGLKSWRTSGILNLEHEIDVIEGADSTTLVQGPPQSRNSRSRSSSGSSLYSDAENEVQTLTLSLSDTSATSVEMINLKDIQRPRRHRRKKIPEEFMKNSLKDSSGSSETGKNFGRVDDAEEHIVEQACMAEDKENIPVNYLKNKDTEVKEVCETTLQNCKMKNMENENQEDKRHSLDNKNQQSPEISNLEMNNQDNSHAKELTIKPEPDDGNCFFKEKLNEDFDLDVDTSSITEAYNKAVEEIAKPSVMYVELNDQEESSTDPPPVNEKQIFTSEVKLSLVGNSRKNASRSSKEHHTKKKFGPRSASLNALRPISRSDTEDEEKRLFVSPDDVIAELKSAIDNPDEFPPRILNFKPKSRDWSPEKPPDYNVVLSFSRTADSFGRNRSASSSLERKILTRTSSASSYESFDSHIAKAEHAIPTRDVRSSTETSYESAPPPLPDSRVPFSSDTDSKASSLAVSRQSSFNDNDSKEFVKPKVPAFSISTYQSRASKISYDKKLSRSESLSSFKEFHGTEDKKQQDDAKTTSLTRSDSRRNQVFKSPDLKKATSTTFLNLQFSDWNDSTNKNNNKNDKNDNKNDKNDNKNDKNDNKNDNKDKNDNKNDDKNDKKNDKNDKKTDSVVRPSMLKKTRSKNLFPTAAPSPKRSMDGSIQFELSSSKEPVTFNRPLPNAYGNLRKTKSTFDIRGNDGRGPDVYETVPDSGLANEYMRLQDDFVKWQQQLLQNQRVLHNRVAPIASNPPTLNSVGLVNNMMNQQASNPQSQPRKPVEITIPIRLVDSDEETNDKETPPPRQVSQSAGQSLFSGPQWRSGPSVPVSAWQERPAPMVRTQPPEAPERSHVPSAMEMQRRPFGKQPGMQTVFQSTPQCRQPQQGLNSFQQIPQQSFQQGPQQTYQHMPQSNYQQMPPSNYQQVPISAYQQVPPSTYQQVPPNTYQQMPPTIYQQVPPTTYQQVPPTTYQQVPPTTYQQVPPTTYQQVPPTAYQQVPPSAYQQVPPATYQQLPQSTFQQMPHSGIQQAPQSSFQQLLSQPDFQQIPQSGYQVSPASIQQPPQSSYQQIPATSFQHDQPNSQFTSRNQPSVLVEPRTQNISDSCINPPCGSDDNINARFSSVVTLSNDKNGQSVPSKDKVWSVVQLNNSETLPTQGRSPAPFQSKIIAGASAPAREEGPDREQRRSPSNTPSGVASVAPISSRLVQQAVQRPLSPGGNGSSVVQPSGVGGAPLSHRISPPRMEREPSPPQHESSPPPFSGVKLRPVETRISPPKTFAFVPKPPSPPNVGLAPLPPPPPQAKVPPPPPPPPGVSDEERRTSTGKKIFSSNNVPQLDAREELMMAIRQFGGSTNLRRSPHPPPQ